MKLSVRFLSLCIAAFMWSCDRMDVSSAGDEQSGRVFLVDQSKAALPRDVTLYDRLEAETIERIRARLGPKELAAFEETLADERAGRIWRVRGDEELSRLLSTLYAIQDARRSSGQEEGLRAVARNRSAEVDVVLVESLGREDIFARVVRTPGPYARNLVYVTPDGLSGERVAMALGSISRLRRADGDYPLKRRVVFLRSSLRLGPEGSVHLSRAAEAVGQIKDAQRQTPASPRVTVTLPPESPGGSPGTR
jgi:hypothetical protein